jgi:type I restriction enzyme S subunit
MNYKYIGVPKTISYEECCKNSNVFAPSKYTRFLPQNKDLFVPMSSICTESKSKIVFDRKKKYEYSEIGDIDVSNGTIEHNCYYGMDLPSKNPKQCKNGDILISTVRTYRGGIGMVTEEQLNYCCSPAIMVIRDVDTRITKEYLLAILRTDFFIEQILGFQTRGMYPRLDSDAMNKVIIPIPKDEKVIDYITMLSIACLNKHSLIKQRHSETIRLIEKELCNNQKPDRFTYNLPKFDDITELSRLDTNMYNHYFKQEVFEITNYQNGYKSIEDLGFKMSRGQNLQVSNIGKSIYSKERHPKFYTLVLPMFLSKYGTIDEVKYLGNGNSLKTLKKGDLIFGAEGFEKGRSIVVIEEETNTITNIHGITLKQEAHNLTKAIFVKCFLDYLRSKGLVDLFAVGGNGGSLAQKYWPYIPFPNFPESKQKEIAALYYNSKKYDTSGFTLDNFLEKDNEFNSEAGIYELDKTAKQLKRILNKAIDDVVNDREVIVTFSEQ